MGKRLLIAWSVLTALALGAAEVLTDQSEKKNYGFGEETKITDVAELAKKLNVTVSDETPYVVWLSDLHVYSKADANKPGDVVLTKDIEGDLKKLFALINQMKPLPAAVLITGDVTHNGAIDQYQTLAGLLKTLNPAIRQIIIPGNHDQYDNMVKVFPAVGACETVGVGNWRIIPLATDKSGDLPDREAEFFAKAIKQSAANPVLILTHHPLMQLPGGENVRPLRETLIKGCAGRTLPVWFLSGHAHTNYMVNIRYPGLPDFPAMTHTSSTSSFGYDAPSLRVLFLGKDQLVGSAIWRYQAPDAGFRIDQKPDQWPVYTPEAMDQNEKLVKLTPDNFKEYITASQKVGEDPRYYYCDGEAVLTFAFPLPEFGDYDHFKLVFDIESDYLVKVGPAPNRLETVIDSGKRQPRQSLSYEVPPALANGVLYVTISDRTPADGFGAFLHAITLSGVKKH